MSQLPAAGWFPDPDRRGALRYWDGASWTEHRHVPPAVHVQPEPAAYSSQRAARQTDPRVLRALALLLTLLLTGVTVALMTKVIDVRAEGSAAVVAGQPGVLAPGADDRAWQTYTDPSGYSLSYPASWSRSDGTANFAVHIEPSGVSPFRRNINVLVERVSSGETLEAYARRSIDMIVTTYGPTIRSNDASRVGDRPARAIVWSAPMSGQPLTFMTVIAISGSQAFVLTYTADSARFDAGLAEVSGVLDTMRLPPA